MVHYYVRRRGRRRRYLQSTFNLKKSPFVNYFGLGKRKIKAKPFKPNKKAPAAMPKDVGVAEAKVLVDEGLVSPGYKRTNDALYKGSTYGGYAAGLYGVAKAAKTASDYYRFFSAKRPRDAEILAARGISHHLAERAKMRRMYDEL